MTEEFLVWKYQPVKHAGGIVGVKGLANKAILRSGLSIAADFPGTVRLLMDPDRPRDMVVGDNVYNTLLQIVVSDRLRAFLVTEALPAVEFLPVRIVDPKGNDIEQPYFILNSYDPVDGVDHQQSVFETDDLMPELISRFKKMVLAADRIPADRQVFRLRGYRRATLIRSALARRIIDGGFTGVQFLAPDVADR